MWAVGVLFQLWNILASTSRHSNQGHWCFSKVVHYYTVLFETLPAEETHVKLLLRWYGNPSSKIYLHSHCCDMSPPSITSLWLVSRTYLSFRGRGCLTWPPHINSSHPNNDYVCIQYRFSNSSLITSMSWASFVQASSHMNRVKFHPILCHV